jgi:ATP phosphoribosyltransferase
MEKIKIAIQKSGRLSEKSIDLLTECGIRISNGTRKLKTEAGNFPMEILFLRDDDIPQYVEKGWQILAFLAKTRCGRKKRM